MRILVVEDEQNTGDYLRKGLAESGFVVDLAIAAHRSDAKEFALMHLLARRQGEILSRSFIASRVWVMNFDSDTNVVDVAVRRLRAKLDDRFEKKLIHTARGMGPVVEHRG